MNWASWKPKKRTKYNKYLVDMYGKKDGDRIYNQRDFKNAKYERTSYWLRKAGYRSKGNNGKFAQWESWDDKGKNSVLKVSRYGKAKRGWIKW